MFKNEKVKTEEGNTTIPWKIYYCPWIKIFTYRVTKKNQQFSNHFIWILAKTWRRTITTLIREQVHALLEIINVKAQRIWFIPNGASPQFSFAVRNQINHGFPNKLSLRDRNDFWPSYSISIFSWLWCCLSRSCTQKF